MPLRNDQVFVAVAVEVAWAGSEEFFETTEVDSPGERPISVILKHGDTVGVKVSYNQVSVSVAVNVSCIDLLGSGTYVVAGAFGKASGPIVDQNGNFI